MTTGETIALTRRTFVVKVMSLLLNTLSRLVITFLSRSKCLLISWLQSPSAVILEPQNIQSDSVSSVSPSISHEVMGPDAMIFVFWMLSFKPTFSLSSFTFIKRLLSSSVVFNSLLPHGLQHARLLFQYLLELAQTHVHWVGDAIQPSRPVSSPSPPAFNISQHQGLFFFSELALQIRWPKYWSFSFSISPVNVYSGLISFRTDCLISLLSKGPLWVNCKCDLSEKNQVREGVEGVHFIHVFG